MNGRLVVLLISAALLAGQTAPPEQKTPEALEKEKEEREQGIPIASDLVQKSCGPCHKADDKHRLSRISYRRTTPEGWQLTIKRMLSLNGLKIEPEQAREILKYLSNHLGLAPEEALPAAFEAERRIIEYKYADKDTEQVCSKCHSMGRIISQRRAKTEWDLLVAMHRGYYPLSDFQAFRRLGPPQTQPGPDGRPPDNRHPMEKAIPHLAETLPLQTAEWSAWSANMRAPKLEGRWALSGYSVGKGPVYGRVVIHASSEDEFTTESEYVYARSGQTVKSSGKAIVYTGFQWRGRSGDLREVMFVDRSLHAIEGRWFTGAYDETGLDVRMERIGADPVVLGVDRPALKTGASGQQVKIYGANLSATAIDFGPGVKVSRVVTATPDVIQVEVEVAKDAHAGPRDIYVAGAAKAAASVVYDKIDGIKVRPQAGLARIGGIDFAKQYQQFEAVAFNNGADGKPDTKDDVNLGLVDAAWSIEEYTATYDDDDKDFVGSIDANGLFTPNVDGPNPKRTNNRNNYGDVWVVATYTPPGGKPLRARAHLLVTVPRYIKFDQPEVSR